MIISGEEIARKIEKKLAEEISHLQRRRPPQLAVILVGDDKASKIYVTMKQRSCERIGILSTTHHCPASISEKELLTLVETLNRDPEVDGILMQLPLPSHLNAEKVVETLSPEKDIDGFHPINIGKLLLGYQGGFIPCTPLGVQQLLLHAAIPTEGKHVVIVGRSNIVGKPMAALLMQKQKGANATVTLCHTGTRHLSEITKQADILIAACGQPEFIKASMVGEGSVVIDVGIQRTEKGIVGDVAFQEVEPKASYITPVPKGIGPMTVVMLMHNTLKSYKAREKI